VIRRWGPIGASDPIKGLGLDFFNVTDGRLKSRRYLTRLVSNKRSCPEEGFDTLGNDVAMVAPYYRRGRH